MRGPCRCMGIPYMLFYTDQGFDLESGGDLCSSKIILCQFSNVRVGEFYFFRIRL